VASYGGRFRSGALYALNASGLITTLHSFSAAEVGYRGSLLGGLVRARDGSLYGVSYGGGTEDRGTIYRVGARGTATIVYSFAASGLHDAANPRGPLTSGPDGALYGVSSTGGSRDAGTIFRVSPDGGTTVLHSFDGLFNSAAGYAPSAPIVVDDHGNIYGVTTYGGADATCYACGVVYRLSHGGRYQLLHTFVGAPDDGAHPPAGLLNALDGSLVGVARGGPNDDAGVVYRLSRAPQKAR
jgi:uncharacterized repeat protein (TIGR03803 family)